MTEEISTDLPEQIVLKNPTPDEVGRVVTNARKIDSLNTTVTVQHRDMQSHNLASSQTYRPALDSAFGNEDNMMALSHEATKRPTEGTNTELVVKKEPLTVPPK